MTSSRLFFLSVLLLGLASVASFHSSGALWPEDARYATVVDGSIAASPPAPVTSRLLALTTDLVRLVWEPTGLFRAMHLSAGVLFAFATAIASIVAARLSTTQGIGAVAAALFVAGSMLFGADFATFGLSAHPVPVLLLLLGAAAWGWTSTTPRPWLSGILLGLATADHPLVLFLLPGFGAFAIQASLRVAPADSAAVVRRSFLGFLLGFSAVFLPVLQVGNEGILHVTQPESPAGALAAWLRAGDGWFWSIGGPQRWVDGIRELGMALWRNTGPVGIILATLGIVTFFGGRARLARPFLVLQLFAAAALVLGNPADHATAAVFVAWPFLFWALPSFAAIESQLAARTGPDSGNALRATPLVAAVSVAALFAQNARSIDRSAERGVDWTETVLRTAPADAILLTKNPVVVALAADGLRPDVDVIDVHDTSTLTAFRGGRMLLPLGEVVSGKQLAPETVVTLVHATEGGRDILVDASVYFDLELRARLFGDQWMFVPHGLAFRVSQRGKNLTPEQRRAAIMAWEDVDLSPGTPPSALRDGLGGSQYIARGMLQSAHLHLEQSRTEDAEREFLLALGNPDANANVAAMGYARFLNIRYDYPQIALVLERYTRDDQEGAWIARRAQGNNLLLLEQKEQAIAAFQRALSLLPVAMREDRARLQQQIRSLRTETPAARPR